MSRTSIVFLKSGAVSVLSMLVCYLFNQDFWWLGLVPGFLLGWLVFGFGDLRTAVPTAFEYAMSGLQMLGKIAYPVQAIRRARPVSLWCLWSIWTAVSPMPVVVLFVLLADWLNYQWWYYLGRESTSGLLSIGAFFVMMLNINDLFSLPFYLDRNVSDREKIASYKRFSLIHGPLLPFWWIYKIGMWVVDLLQISALVFAEICLFTARFVWKLFVLVHTHERALIVTDGVLGAAVAFPTLVVGAHMQVLPALSLGFLLGGLLGVINFELISKRVLNIIPTN